MHAHLHFEGGQTLLALRLIFASLWRQRSLYVLWVLSLCFAINGLMIIDVYRVSLSNTLALQGTKILTADMALSTRRLLTGDESKVLKGALPAGTRFSALTEMFAMVSSENESRLAMLRFIDDGFPLIGDLKIKSAGQTAVSTGAGLAGTPKAWVAADLLPLMDVSEGSEIRIGQVTFTIAGVIAKDSSQTFRMGPMAPRIYLHKNYLTASQLIQFGSTFSDSLFAALPPTTPIPDLKKSVERNFPDPSMQVTVPADLEQGSLRVLSRLLDYLGLVGLVTLSIGWIGVYYLGRRWLMLEQNAGGLLKCLGFTTRDIHRLWVIKLSLILFLGVAIGGLVAWTASHLAVPIFSEGLPDDFSLTWTWRNTFLLILIGPGTGWLLLSEAIARAASTPPLQLIGNQVSARRPIYTWVVLPVGLAVLGVALTFLQARSWTITGVFLASLVGSAAFVVGIAAIGLLWVRTLRQGRSGWIWHTSLSMWLRRPAIAILLVTVSALTGLLSQLIPHLQKTIVGELQSPDDTNRPGLFLFDIQDEQKEPLQKLLEEKQIAISEQSPFIRARILKVNGQDFERLDVNSWSTREEEVDARMRNRGVNLTFRNQLGPAEKVIAGKDFDQLTTEEISVEEAYAERLKIKIGDQLMFDVQGVEVPGKVANLREVNWDSFQPNFFMQFKSGAIDGAPKTWIFTLKRDEKWPPAQVQKLIAKQYPNVTSINIAETVNSLSELLGKLGAGLSIASRLSLALGLFVFVMILLFQLLSSEKDWIQLHRQGLTDWDLLRLQFAAYGTLSLFGVLLGSGLSILVCWTLAQYAFSIRPRFDWVSLFNILFFTWFLSAAALFWLSRRQFKQTQFKSRFDAL